MPEAPQKAYLSLINPDSRGEDSKIHFQFNPKEFTLQKSAKWTSKPARGSKKASMPQFEGSQPETISLEMFLDASERGAAGIEADIEKLLSCVEPLETAVEKNKPSPPWVVFMWGTRASVTMFVKQVQVKYTMFKADGTPLRALCTVQMEEIPRISKRQNPTSGGLAPVRSHTVVAGDSLASIAFDEYGAPALWRAIAVSNGLDDPMRLRMGSRLLLPTEGDAAELARIGAEADRARGPALGAG